MTRVRRWDQVYIVVVVYPNGNAEMSPLKFEVSHGRGIDKLNLIHMKKILIYSSFRTQRGRKTGV